MICSVNERYATDLIVTHVIVDHPYGCIIDLCNYYLNQTLQCGRCNSVVATLIAPSHVEDCVKQLALSASRSPHEDLLPMGV